MKKENLSPLEVEFAEWLKQYHRGEANAVKAREMVQWGNSRELRNMVNNLRVNGYPICTGNVGYYYALTRAELNGTIKFLASYMKNIKHAYVGLVGAYTSSDFPV